MCYVGVYLKLICQNSDNITRVQTLQEFSMLFTNLNKRLDDEFLLIYTKLKAIENQLDLIIVKLNQKDNPEDLLSPSEIAMMHSWRNQAKAMESEEPN